MATHLIKSLAQREEAGRAEASSETATRRRSRRVNLFLLVLSGLVATTAEPVGAEEILRPIETHAEIRALEIRGPFLLNVERVEGRALLPVSEEDLDDLLPEGGGKDIDPEEPREGDDKGETVTEGASKPTIEVSWDVASNYGVHDLAIAAGFNHVLVTTSFNLIIYDKGTGAELKAMSAKQFFDPILADVNAHLNVPSSKYEIDFVYDTRLLFDTYRKRFWFGALARNNGARNGDATDKTYRRTKFFVGVSRTDDPMGEWYLYWWNAIVDDGVCNYPTLPSHTKECPSSPFRPGDGADYPIIGISSTYLMEANGTNLYDFVSLASADQLASGQAPQGKFIAWQLWNLRNLDGSVARGFQPAHHYGSHGKRHHLASTVGGDHLAIWSIEVNWGALPGPIYITEMPVKKYAWPRDVPQRSSTGVPQPPSYRLGTNVGSLVMGATVRDGNFYAIWHDCHIWSGQSICTNSLRMVRAMLTPLGIFVVTDSTFGLRNPVDDPPNAVVSYGWPTLAVNGDGTMVMAYQRVGVTVFPEARYSLFFASELNIRPSLLIKSGEAPLVEGGPGVGRIDYAGSAVDPSADHEVWIAQAYTKLSPQGTGRRALRIAKVVP